MSESHSRTSRVRRLVALMAWSALVVSAFCLWNGRMTGSMQVQTLEPVAFVLSTFSAFVGVFAWMLFNPARRSAVESPSLFFAAAATLFPPPIIGFCLMPVDSPLRGWLALVLFLLTVIAVLSHVPDDFFRVPRGRHTYLTPLPAFDRVQDDVMDPTAAWFTFTDLSRIVTDTDRPSLAPRAYLQRETERPQPSGKVELKPVSDIDDILGPELDVGLLDDLLWQDHDADPSQTRSRSPERPGAERSGAERTDSNRLGVHRPDRHRPERDRPERDRPEQDQPQQGRSQGRRSVNDHPEGNRPAAGRQESPSAVVPTLPHRAPRSSEVENREPAEEQTTGPEESGPESRPRRGLRGLFSRFRNTPAAAEETDTAATLPMSASADTEDAGQVSGGSSAAIPEDRPSPHDAGGVTEHSWRRKNRSGDDLRESDTAQPVSENQSTSNAPRLRSSVSQAAVPTSADGRTAAPQSVSTRSAAARSTVPTYDPSPASDSDSISNSDRSATRFGAERETRSPVAVAPSGPVSRTIETRETSTPGPGRSAQPELQRTQDASGGELVEGVMIVRFDRGQKRANLHVPFSPPLAGIPEVECECMGDEQLRLKVPVRQSYGIRIEARRTNADEPLETEVGFAAFCESV